MEILSENKKFGIRYGIDDDGLLFFGDGKHPEIKITFHDSEEQRNLCMDLLNQNPKSIIYDFERKYRYTRLLTLENAYNEFLYRGEYRIEDLRIAYKILNELLEDNLLQRHAMEKAIQSYEIRERQKGFYNLLDKGVFDLSGLNKLFICYNSCIDLSKCTDEICHRIFVSKVALKRVIIDKTFPKRVINNENMKGEPQ